MGKQRTTSQFILEASSVHNGKFSYANTNFVGVRNKVKVTCPSHGDFEVEAKAHLKGVDCAKCSYGSKIRKSATIKDFLTRAEETHGSKYFYDNVVFSNYKTKVIVTCPTHGDFSICPTNFIWGRQGCAACKVTGFNPDKAAYFYVLAAGDILKVGITNSSPLFRSKRVSKSSGRDFLPVLTIKDGGEDVLKLENDVLVWLRKNATPLTERFEGYTECFTDILLDKLVEVINTYHKGIK